MAGLSPAYTLSTFICACDLCQLRAYMQALEGAV